MTPLDSQTPKGQICIAAEEYVASRICEMWGCSALRLGAEAAHFDRLFHRGGQIVAVAEIKNRDMDWEQLVAFGSYLITAKKLEQGAQLARLLSAPFYLFVRLGDSKDMVYWPVANTDGDIVVAHTIRRTQTQATVNGGIAVRDNAYLSLEDAVRKCI